MQLNKAPHDFKPCLCGVHDSVTFSPGLVSEFPLLPTKPMGWILLIVLGMIFLPSQTVSAQDLRPRYGIGVGTMYSSPDGFGMGLHGRGALPLNADISTALDIGFTGFLFGGWRKANYIIEPQLSVVITMPPSGMSAGYLLFGAGVYLPTTRGAGEGGPTVHLGIGQVYSLRESSLFVEINPALIIKRDRLAFMIPLRTGIIL